MHHLLYECPAGREARAALDPDKVQGLVDKVGTFRESRPLWERGLVPWADTYGPLVLGEAEEEKGGDWPG